MIIRVDQNEIIWMVLSLNRQLYII